MLDESRHHLSEIKMSWSAKINSLETQIAHLNRKMAEDGDDAQRLEVECRDLSTKVQSLKCKSGSLEKENERLRRINDEFEEVKGKFHHCKAERNRLRSENDSLGTNIRSLRNDLNELSELKRKEDSESKNKIDSLMSQQSEHLEKEIENENKISDYEAVTKRLKHVAAQREGECSSLKEKLSVVTEKSLNLERENVRLSGEIEECIRCAEERNNAIESLEIELENIQQGE